MRKTEVGGRKLGRGDLRRKIERETERELERKRRRRYSDGALREQNEKDGWGVRACGAATEREGAR